MSYPVKRIADGLVDIVWAHNRVRDGVARGLGERSISLRSEYQSKRESSVSWGTVFYRQGFGGREAVAVIWAEGNAPKDGAILGRDMAPRVVERAGPKSHEAEHRRRRELRLIDGACFGIEGNVGGAAVRCTAVGECSCGVCSNEVCS